MMPKLFVYGTLRNGGHNHFYLSNATSIYHQSWIEGSLYDTDNGYPVLLSDNRAGYVYGELYDVCSAQLKKIDQLEQYVEGDPDNLYDRECITVTNDKDDKVKALTYVGGKRLIDSNDWIETGDWNVHTYLKQQNLLYFAYGSCMDDERFTLQCVDHHFKNIIGSALLNGFELQFSRNSTDGGKADIVENNNEKVEGKVYQVPLEAVSYLYKREGVYVNAYRPIIIDILLKGENKRAITFIGTQKEAETAPTINYASEIMRGSSGFLSDSYVATLQNKINMLFKQ
ncbi:gamma-glutamylcyclotransferase [Virgibacillus necropolis]|uniref:Gamma-glutamylcyclotransferase n=1 Tax=Virgibacillus necropolis TaxID=163877 RepID=A0A221MDA3_9BACI|nr:gamma-glutamylcyclotransferase [Virgibacillus necropolis]ASN05590.1 gamma-glutamylcyclotransferase [Virgibacillus necropolis]